MHARLILPLLFAGLTALTLALAFALGEGGRVSEPPDQPSAEREPDPAPDPQAEPLAAGLPAGVPLNRVFRDALEHRDLVSATPRPAAAALAGIERADGATRDPDQIVVATGLVEMFTVTYAAPSQGALDLVSIEISRHQDATGAARLLAIVRENPLEAGDRDVSPRRPAADRPTYAVLRSASTDPDAAPLLRQLDLHAVALIVLDGNLAVRVAAWGQSAEAAIAAADAVAQQQLQLLAAARSGQLQSALDVPFPLLTPEVVAERLPPAPAGFGAQPPELDEDGVQALYARADGAFVLVVIILADGADDAMLVDSLLNTSQGLSGFLEAAFPVLEAESRPAPAGLGERAIAGRFSVEVQGQQLSDIAVSFRRGPAWVIVQGIGAPGGDLPVDALALAIDARLREALAEQS